MLKVFNLLIFIKKLCFAVENIVYCTILQTQLSKLQIKVVFLHWLVVPTNTLSRLGARHLLFGGKRSGFPLLEGKVKPSRQGLSEQWCCFCSEPPQIHAFRGSLVLTSEFYGVGGQFSLAPQVLKSKLNKNK